VEVSNGEDDVTKKSVGDDAGDGGASSTESIAPSPIRSDAPERTDPLVADRVTSTTPLVDEWRHKHTSLIPKWK
jgi:hypothetical protein